MALDQYSRIFGRRQVLELTSRDFTLDQELPIRLVYDDQCTVVLFHGDNLESTNLATVFALAANYALGPVFAHLNLARETRVAEAFSKIRNRPGVYQRFALVGYPHIIAYQAGEPVGFYNGDRDAQAIVNWSYELACKPGYVELEQLSRSAHLDQSIEMGPHTTQAPAYTSSTQFKAGQSLNGYDPRTGVVATGTRQAVGTGGPAGAGQATFIPTAASVPTTLPTQAPVPSTSGIGTPVRIG